MIRNLTLLTIVLAALGCGTDEPAPLVARPPAPDSPSDGEDWSRDLAHGLATLAHPWTDMSEEHRTHLSLEANDFLSPRGERASAVRLRIMRGGVETPVYASWDGGSTIEGECVIPSEATAGLARVEVVTHVGASESEPPLDVAVEVYYRR